MKLFQTLRSPKIALFLSFLMIFVSCSNERSILEDNTNNVIWNNVTLSQTIKKHIELSKNFAQVILNHPLIKETNFNKQKSFYNSDAEYRNSLIRQGYINVDEIVEISRQIRNNLEGFMISKNYNKNTINKDDLINIVSKEIIHQQEINKNKIFSKSASDSCKDANENATENCGENFYIGTSVSIIVGFFTFGIGTVAGLAVSSGLLIKCTDDAYEAYQDCIAK